jgi:hypothetical protein
MNKKAEEAGGEAWSKIIQLILIIAVLFLVLWAVFFSDIPGWLNNLLPDFLKYSKDNSAMKLEQTNIPEIQKSLDCPSSYRAITLVYRGWTLDDQFKLRYNEKLNKVQIYIWPNYIFDSIRVKETRPKKASKEWLIYADSDLGGISKNEFRELEFLLGSDTKNVFIYNLIDVVKKDKKLHIYLGNLEEGVNEQDKDKLSLDKIQAFLDAPSYQEQYKEALKTASDKCKPIPPTP